MLNSISKYIGYEYLAFAVSFVFIYYFPDFTFFTTSVVLLLCYSKILKYAKLDVVIMLCVYSRCLNGFLVPHNKVFFDIVNIFCNVLPLILYIFKKIRNNTIIPTNTNFILKNYRFTIAFFVLLTGYFCFDLFSVSDLITKRLLPLFFFILFLWFSDFKDFSVESFLKFSRIILWCSLILFFLPDYSERSTALIQSDQVFSKSSEEYSLIFFGVFRNVGIFFDHRILAIFCCLVLGLSATYNSKFLPADMMLCLSVAATTLARGGIFTCILILLAIIYLKYRKFFWVSSLGIVSITVSGSIFISLNPDTLSFINTFNLSNDENAFTQRGGFSEYALNEFYNNPIFGNGVGHVSSSLITRNVLVGEATYNVVTDAFLFSLLAEMGVVGLIIFLKSYFEILSRRSLITNALLFGLLVQLLGTDIPDMRFFYFGILVLMFFINAKFPHPRLRIVTNER